jgi:hypothetical protein
VNSKLQQLFDKLEADRNNLLVTLRTFPSDRLEYAPEGKWSIREILAHLISAEKLSVQYINKKILGIRDVEDTGVWDEVKMVLLQASQRLPLKFKAPTGLVENTPANQNLDQLMADWEKTRVELKILLEKFDDTQIRKKIYKHVRAGRLNIQHALMFFREHIIHHSPQINRLLKL